MQAVSRSCAAASAVKAIDQRSDFLSPPRISSVNVVRRAYRSLLQEAFRNQQVESGFDLARSPLQRSRGAPPPQDSMQSVLGLRMKQKIFQNLFGYAQDSDGPLFQGASLEQSTRPKEHGHRQCASPLDGAIGAAYCGPPRQPRRTAREFE
jgi:hypothetical protein